EVFKSKTTLFRNAVGVSPDSAWAQEGLGDGLVLDGNDAAAIAPLRRAIELDPKMQPAHLSLGIAQLNLNLLADAEKSFRTAVAIKPGDVMARCNLAALLTQEDRWQDARSVLSEALKTDPTRPEAVDLMGQVLMHLGDLRGAAALYKDV